MSLEVVLGLQVLAEDTVVVDFAVNGEGEGGVIVDKGLGTGVLGIISNAPYHQSRDLLRSLYLPTPTIHRRS